MPRFRRSAVFVEIDRKIIEAHVCFLDLWAMATDAMRLKDWKDIAVEIDVALAKRSTGALCDADQAKNDGEPP